MNRLAVIALTGSALLTLSACGAKAVRAPAAVSDAAMPRAALPPAASKAPTAPSQNVASSPRISVFSFYEGPDGHPEQIDGVRWYWCLDDQGQLALGEESR